ncbi:hypothetical protein [Streptomyces parvus]|uniref:Uncharacterized protein n=1 Tax=Streptomyces parvus TaxID=66428 RepID=A0A7K3S560_9ACTN|nr:hypothetical protein [Streptomyces parvus]NEC22646.1 hypothetical protein [Streptomyces parvus]
MIRITLDEPAAPRDIWLEKTFTVAFGAYNEAGVESLTRVFPDIGQGKDMGTLHQSYYWTVTVGP